MALCKILDQYLSWERQYYCEYLKDYTILFIKHGTNGTSRYLLHLFIICVTFKSQPFTFDHFKILFALHNLPYGD